MQPFPDGIILPGMKSATAVGLSFFHPKEGPKIVYLFPEKAISGDIQLRVAEIMDKTYEEGFYTHSFSNYLTIDFFFQIYSMWARGSKEMVMVSTIFDEKITPDLEYALRPLSMEFAQNLKEVDDVYKGFYFQDEKHYPQERQAIRKMDAFLLRRVETLYVDTNARISEKIFEKQLQSLAIFSEDDGSPIRWLIGEDGIKILLSILRGARTRKQIASQAHISLETIAKAMPSILSIDLATEGIEIVLTNRGLKFLGLIGGDFDKQYFAFEQHIFRSVYNRELTQLLSAVMNGAQTVEEIAVSCAISPEVTRKRLLTALNVYLLQQDPNISLTPRGNRYLQFTKSNEKEKIETVENITNGV